MAIMTATSTRDAISAHCTRRPRIDARGDRALRSAAFGAPAASLRPPTAEADATPAASQATHGGGGRDAGRLSGHPRWRRTRRRPPLRPPTVEADATLRYRG